MFKSCGKNYLESIYLLNLFTKIEVVKESILKKLIISINYKLVFSIS